MKLIEKVRETAKVLKTLSRKPRRQPPKRLQARVRATTAIASDEYEEEPQTKLTSAFVVVLILHLVAVGGIYAFNEIKASRKTIDSGRVAETVKPTSGTAAAAATSATKDVEKPIESTGAIASNLVPAATGTITPAVARPRIYTVKSGDTLHGIAKTYGMNVSEIKAANGLTGDGIRQGQTLNLVSAKSVPVLATNTPTERPEPPGTKASHNNYTVKSGDRLVFIAKRFNVSQEDLIALNKIKDPAKLQIGQTLKIPSKK
jgi:LysM repeat protein